MKNNVLNVVKYTVQSLYPFALIEREARITYRRKLTFSGALRILRKTLQIQAVAVVGIESFSV